jgi:hypothetical protein
MVLGLSPDQVQRTLAQADSVAGANAPAGARAAGNAGQGETAGSMGGTTPSGDPRAAGRGGMRGDSSKGDRGNSKNGGGRGGDMSRGGQPGGDGAPTDAQKAEYMRRRAAGGGGGGGGGGGFNRGQGGGGGMPGMGGAGGFGGAGGGFGGGAQRPGMRQSRAFFSGSYIVFLLRNGQPAPQKIKVGVTDMDYSEVTSGLTDRDTVLLLPSASLVQAQADMKDRFTRMTGGGLPGMKQAAPVGGAGGGGAAKGR